MERYEANRIAIDLQVIFHRGYKTYWEETQAIIDYLEKEFAKSAKCNTKESEDNKFQQAVKAIDLA